MSYDLYLGRREPPPADEVARVLSNVPNMALLDDGSGAQYSNEATGVYFSLDFGDPFEEEEDDLPPPPIPVVLALNINFNRAAFFGLECFEVMEPICDALDLLVFNDYDEEPAPAPFDGEEQFELWDAGNHAAADILAREVEQPPFMERERAIEWWRYARRRPDIDERFLRKNYDVFVPTLMLVHDLSANVVLRAVAWPDVIPFVVPPLDVLIVQRTTGGRFRRKTQQGVIAADDALPPLAQHLEPFDGDLRILTPEAAARDDLRAAVAAYELAPLDPSRYAAIEPDGFSDLRPAAA